LDGVVEPPSDIRALCAQGLHSIHNNNNKYIELPKPLGHAFCAAIDTRAVASRAVASNAEPKSHCDAMRPPDSELWHQAMVRKMEAHLKNNRWELIKLLRRHKAIGSKWVFKVTQP
jgi:hypothetical protein